MSIAKPVVKVFVDGVDERAFERWIPVFHGWIQDQALPGTLIDVADYRHVAEGPGLMVVAHDGYYALEALGGRWGVSYAARRIRLDSFDEELESAATRLLAAAQAFVAAGVDGAPQFRGDELSIVANDRLAAPNDEATYGWFEAAARRVGERWFAGAPIEVEREADPRARPGVLLRCAQAATIEAASAAFGLS